MSLKFIPPKQAARYALFVDHKSSSFFKVYSNLGHAKTAHAQRNYNTRYDAKILEMVNGEWYVLHDIKAGTERENLPWKKQVNVGGWYSNRTTKRSVPMTRDEYAEWRLKVERERVAEEKRSLSEQLSKISTTN